MNKSKRISIMASSLIFLSGIACGAAIINQGDDNSHSIIISADDSVYNGLVYVANKDNTITIKGHTDEANVINVVIPNEIDGKKVTSIGEKAFYNCKTISTLILGKNITSIGDYAFASDSSYNKIKLDDTTVSDNIEALAANAFENVDIYKLSIPDSVTFIPARFYVDTALTEINVEEGNKNYSSDKGVLYNGDKSNLIKFPQNSGLLSYTVNDKTVSIEKNAFSKSAQLTKVIIGSSVETIGDHAFFECQKLSSITLDKKVASIGDYAFAGDNSYNPLKFDEINISCTIDTMGENAFKNVDIAKINISDSVESIPEKLYCNTALTEINIDENNKYFSSDKGVLYNADKSTLIKFPKSCSLNSYVIDDNTTSIEKSAFSSCSKLSKITVSDKVETIGDYCFYNCFALSDITLGKNVISIGDYAFSSENSYSTMTFNQITLSDNIEIIGEHAFNYTSISKIIVPDSVTLILPKLYSNGALTEINVAEGNKTYCSEKGVLYNADKSVLIRCPKKTSLISYTIPENTTTITENAFNQCKGITKIVIGNNVKYINSYAFYDCAKLSSLVLGKNVSSIGEYAFASKPYSNSITLSEITIPDNIESMDDTAFNDTDIKKLNIPSSVTSVPSRLYNDTALTEINAEKGNEHFSADKGVLYNGDKSTLIKCPQNSSLLTYNISENTNSIEKSAFLKTKMQTIFIPASVTTIGSDAFKESSLKTIKGIAGSYAETYATNNKYTFTAVDPVTTTATVTTAVTTTKKDTTSSTTTPTTKKDTTSSTTTPTTKKDTTLSTTIPTTKKDTTSSTTTSTDRPKINYDVNGDGKINIMDIVILKKYILKSAE